MAACDPRTFFNVNTDVFNALKGKLADNGYEVPGTDGVIKGPFGISIQFAWNEEEATLFTHVTHKNFLVPCSQINNALEKAIRECGGL